MDVAIRRLGYPPQNVGCCPAFTVVESVEYFALLKDIPPGRVNKAVAADVERVGLGARAKAGLRTLSGGMPRRVGIAQAIVNDPDLLLDESASASAPGSGPGFARCCETSARTLPSSSPCTWPRTWAPSAPKWRRWTLGTSSSGEVESSASDVLLDLRAERWSRPSTARVRPGG
jgi:hypothetical protein